MDNKKASSNSDLEFVKLIDTLSKMPDDSSDDSSDDSRNDSSDDSPNDSPLTPEDSATGGSSSKRFTSFTVNNDTAFKGSAEYPMDPPIRCKSSLTFTSKNVRKTIKRSIEEGTIMSPVPKYFSDFANGLTDQNVVENSDYEVPQLAKDDDELEKKDNLKP